MIEKNLFPRGTQKGSAPRAALNWLEAPARAGLSWRLGFSRLLAPQRI